MTKKHLIMTNDNAAEVIAIDDEDVSEVPALPVAKDGETIDWQKEAEKYQGMATRRGTKLTKLKGAQKPPEEKPVDASQANKKVELDYGQKAYLNSLGFKDVEDHAYVQGIVQSSGKSLEEVLAMPFVTGELKRIGEERTTKNAAPSNDSGRQGAPARDSVEYWLNKGELPPSDQPELRRKVVNAKIAKDRNSSQFTSQPVVK